MGGRNRNLDTESCAGLDPGGCVGGGSCGVMPEGAGL